MVSPVISEGVQGVNNARRELAGVANQLARAGVNSPATPSSPQAEGQVGGQPELQASTIPPVGASARSERGGGIAEPLAELRKQELVFNASAQVIANGNDTLGRLLDTLA